VNRIPIMAKQTLDLYELFRLVVSKGGLVEVINKKLWREITKGLNLPSSITSAAFTLRTQSVQFSSLHFTRHSTSVFVSVLQCWTRLMYLFTCTDLFVVHVNRWSPISVCWYHRYEIFGMIFNLTHSRVSLVKVIGQSLRLQEKNCEWSVRPRVTAFLVFVSMFVTVSICMLMVVSEIDVFLFCQSTNNLSGK